MAQPRILNIALDKITPSLTNMSLYRPVRADDPAIIELAQDIREHGILEPLIITTDCVIVSGHRPYAAARLAGLQEVPCRIFPMQSDDPRFAKLLVACNKQRAKTLDEFMREIIASTNPDEAFAALLSHRAKRLKSRTTLSGSS
jgi:ParB family chromosome partitioning protein